MVKKNVGSNTNKHFRKVEAFCDLSGQSLYFPIQLKQMTIEQRKEYNLKRLERLSKVERAKLDFKVDGSVWKDGKPIAEEPRDEQKRWVLGRLKAPEKSWEAFNQWQD